MQSLLCGLGPQVPAVGEAVSVHDRQRDVVLKRPCLLRRASGASRRRRRGPRARSHRVNQSPDRRREVRRSEVQAVRSVLLAPLAALPRPSCRLCESRRVRVDRRVSAPAERVASGTDLAGRCALDERCGRIVAETATGAPCCTPGSSQSWRRFACRVGRATIVLLLAVIAPERPARVAADRADATARGAELGSGRNRVPAEVEADQFGPVVRHLCPSRSGGHVATPPHRRCRATAGGPIGAWHRATARATSVARPNRSPTCVSSPAAARRSPRPRPPGRASRPRTPPCRPDRWRRSSPPPVARTCSHAKDGQRCRSARTTPARAGLPRRRARQRRRVRRCRCARRRSDPIASATGFAPSATPGVLVVWRGNEQNVLALYGWAMANATMRGDGAR